MTIIAFRHGHCHVAQHFTNGGGLALIIANGAQPMSHYATDIGRSNAGVAQGAQDCPADGYALQNLAVDYRFKCRGEAEDASQNGSAPGLGVLVGLEHESRGAFAVDHAVASGVEGPGSAWRIVAAARQLEYSAAKQHGWLNS